MVAGVVHKAASQAGMAGTLDKQGPVRRMPTAHTDSFRWESHRISVLVSYRWWRCHCSHWDVLV
jgi:hypothetical protein